MLASLGSLKECVMNALKSIGKYVLLLDKEKCELVKEFVKFLKSLKKLIVIVNDSNNSFDIIPLVKTKIVEICSPKADDIDEINSFKLNKWNQRETF